LYFLGLSTRNVARALSFLHIVKRSHVAIWNWIQKYPLKRISSRRNKINEFIVDESVIKVGPEPTWLWVAIDSKNKRILAQSISKERNMFVAERFLSKTIEEYGKHPVSTDGGTWYPQACRFLKLQHHIHSPFEKSLIERTMQYIKDRTESFDDYFPCKRKNCKLNHVNNWLNLFAHHYNKGISV
jgi:putative transposase